MGTLLIFEMMIESVILARDRFLAVDGVMWPSHATLLLAPATATAFYDEKVLFWRAVNPVIFIFV